MTPNVIWADDDLVCGKEPDDRCRVKYIRADIVDPISCEVEALLSNIAQILDVVKTEWGKSWSEFDQEQRDHITRLLAAKSHLSDFARVFEKATVSTGKSTPVFHRLGRGLFRN